MKLFVSDFHWQMLKATEILASDWLRAHLSVKITDKMLCETPPWLQLESLTVMFVSIQSMLRSRTALAMLCKTYLPFWPTVYKWRTGLSGSVRMGCTSYLWNSLNPRAQRVGFRLFPKLTSASNPTDPRNKPVRHLFYRMGIKTLLKKVEIYRFLLPCIWA